jgi:hypothetical protein
MKKYLLLVAIIFILFGGCSTHRKVLKSQSELKVENNIESNQEFASNTTAVKLGKTSINESARVEEISVKKPINIELTANFRIDSTATLRGDTALKLVDVSDRNVSVTIYQNGKNGQLTAKIKSKHSVEDVPFSEISIKKSITNKVTNIDTSKIDSSKVSAKVILKDKSKVVASAASVEKDAEKVNYLFLIGFLVLVGFLLWWLSKN